MKVITEDIAGQVIEGDSAHAVYLLGAESAEHVYLAYALTTLGPEDLMLPKVLLDDWGNEKTGTQIYEWIRENGNQFPRAEVFAVGIDGRERQHFLRDLELYITYPVYALPTPTSAATSAVAIAVVLIPDSSVTAPTRTERPATIGAPLRWGRVSWWLVPPAVRDLSFLESPSEET